MAPKRSFASSCRKRVRSDEDESEEGRRQVKKMRPGIRLTTVKQVITALQDVFLQHANPTRANQMKKYLRGQFDFFGIQTPERRALSAGIYSRMSLSHGSSSSTTWPMEKMVQLIRSLWRLPQREFQYFAMDLAEKEREVFCEDFDKAVDCLRIMITESSWWDTVDMIASHLVGHLVALHGERGKKLMDEWIDDECMWLRRTVILHQLSYKERCDEARLFTYCLERAHEKEFFIRKAIGWALRTHGRTRPAFVKRFVLEHDSELSSLSKQEALKHLSSVES